MNKLNIKNQIVWILSLILSVITCTTAFASKGDRVLFHSSNQSGYYDDYIQDVFLHGNGFVIINRKNYEHSILYYSNASTQPETFVLNEETLQEENKNEDSQSYAFVYNWFSWKNEIYALVGKTTYGDDYTHNEFFVQKAKLEKNLVVLEKTDDLPELDLSSLVTGEDGFGYVRNIINMFTFRDKLMIILGEDQTETLEIINLQDGYCSEKELDDCDIIPGMDGNLLILKPIWSETDKAVTIQIRRMDPNSMNEELLAEIPGCNSTMIAPCYDSGTDTLYFIRNGELCAMPQFDTERIVSVNDCSVTGERAYYLTEGFVLIKTYDSVLIKNTDPSQRGSINLRIVEAGWDNVISETIYDMNNMRGDVSVILQQSRDVKTDVLQAMMTRDDSVDIYVMHYDNNEFSALRNRGYLPDLGENKEIVKNINRLYPYIQNALKQNGDIIGIPLTFRGATIGINKEVWKYIGGKDEEIPQTWSQFFSWLKTIPERLEGKEISFIGDTDRAYFRGEVLHMLLSQYEILMEQKNDKNYAFDSPVLCELVQKLNDVDYDSLHVANHWIWEENDTYENPESMKTPLLDIGTSILMNGQNEFDPMALSLFEGEKPVLPVEMDVAFLNPYSEHLQEAMEFLALAMDNLDLYDKYTAYSDMTEPLRYPDFEENMRLYKETIDELGRWLEVAQGEDKEQIEESIRLLTKNQKDDELNSWRISPKMINKYHEWQDLYTVQGYTFFNDLFTADSDEENYNEFENIFRNMENAKMSPEELLRMLDKKVRMIRLERE